MPERQTLTEARGALLVEATDTPGRYRIKIIDSGWGSSGYYSPEVLQEAGERHVFKAGLKMYAGHPNADGSGVDKDGNRSVSDVWGKLVTDATWRNGALMAEAEVRPDVRPVVDFLSNAIGLSIRGFGTFEEGEAEDRRGPIVTRLDEVLSVDFVTDAGRGGEILSLVESAQRLVQATDDGAEELQEARNVGQWIESRLHLSLTQIADEMFGDGRLTREERIALSGAVGDGLTAFTSTLESAAPQLYERDLWDGPAMADMAEAAMSMAAMAKATNLKRKPGESDADFMARMKAAMPAESAAHPETPAPGSEPPATAPTTPIQEDHMPETPGAGAAPPLTPRQVLEAGQTQLRRQVAELQARDRARSIIAESLGDAWLPASTVARLSGELLEGLPLVEDTLDEAALRDRVTARRDVAETEMAEAMQAAGVGLPRGLGSSAGPNGGGLDPAAAEAQLAEAFGRLGLSESQSKIAAKGR